MPHEYAEMLYIQKPIHNYVILSAKWYNIGFCVFANLHDLVMKMKLCIKKNILLHTAPLISYCTHITKPNFAVKLDFYADEKQKHPFSTIFKTFHGNTLRLLA